MGDNVYMEHLIFKYLLQLYKIGKAILLLNILDRGSIRHKDLFHSIFRILGAVAVFASFQRTHRF